ncbi:WD40-repeat-containing domain protein [Lentinula edodes]|uniref:WD40-repeat-containing domain protein n=1 Tax=Lentinula lateritia TaxID=40482 RepID=A0A9W8ZNP1_9AGAR|nr:WD40-repeat-containing domain protein [Lentinula edodes]
MTLTVQGVKERLEFEQHTVPISALDFSEQYGTLVSASIEDSQSTARNLLSGTEPGRLRGHVETVKCIQIEDTVCVTGSEDCSVRLWDLRLVDADGSDGWGDEARTGQAHRTLVGHSAPVTCLQFDEVHIASGSLDKTIQIWDIYNRTSTSMQHSTLLTNGHTSPVERLRYMDRYTVTGGRDTVKVYDTDKRIKRARLTPTYSYLYHNSKYFRGGTSRIISLFCLVPFLLLHPWAVSGHHEEELGAREDLT